MRGELIFIAGPRSSLKTTLRKFLAYHYLTAGRIGSNERGVIDGELGADGATATAIKKALKKGQTAIIEIAVSPDALAFTPDVVITCDDRRTK